MTDTHASRAVWLFRLSSVLWAIWGVVHIFAGVMTHRLIANGKNAEAFHGIVAAVELESLRLEYPDGVIAVFSQHATNLAWFGAVTLLCAFWIWRGNRNAIFLAAIVGGLADLAYFAHIDLGGFAMPPGPQMTYICAAAVVTGLWGARSEART